MCDSVLVMKTVFLVLLILATASGLVAKPLTFTYSEYQVDPATYEEGEDYPLDLLAGQKPIASQSVELSPEGKGKAVATIGNSTVSLEVSSVPNKDSLYRFSVKHEFVSAYSGDFPITSSRGTNTSVTLKLGDELVVGGLKGGVDGSVEAYVTVVKLTD